jgi:hypothetical protein
MNHSPDSNIILTLTNKLYHLRSQRAIFGSAYVPAHIEIDIQETEKQLEQLVLQRTQLMFDARHLTANPPPFVQGLITAVSVLGTTHQLKDQAAFQAIDYHRRLRQCWLIATSEKNTQCSEPTAHELKHYFERYGIDCRIYLLENGADPLEMQRLVTKIYQEIEQAGEYTENDLICDITSGTKAMTIGMALACGTKYAMQYMLQYEQGLPSLPVLLHIDS